MCVDSEYKTVASPGGCVVEKPAPGESLIGVVDDSV